MAEAPAGDGKRDIILKVKDLKMHFPLRQGLLQRRVGTIKAVDGVSFELREQEVMGLVGESGCGKTTVGRALLRLYDPTGGEVLFHRADGSWVDVAQISRKEMKDLRKEMRMIFQDPFSSLNPRLTVRDIIAEPLVIHNSDRDKITSRVAELMEAVGLKPAYMGRYPHEFSGGQRQRIGVARTLALNPRLIVADEPVSALDVSVQAQVLNLLQTLRDELRLTFVFISHDLSVVEHICDKIAVMYVGKLVELAPTDELLRNPKHPYTEALVSAVPPADPLIKMERIILEGDVPSPANPPSGCVFHPRCRYAQDICQEQEPPLVQIGPDHHARCHFSEELELQEWLMSRQKHKDADRRFAALAYILPVIGGLLGLALDGGNPLTRVHARQSISTVIALIITFFVWAAVGYVLSLIPIAGPIVAIALFSLVIAMAAFLAANWLFSFVMALRGEERTIPFANRVALRVFGNGGAETPSA